jgi:hypothetical protein
MHRSTLSLPQLYLELSGQLHDPAALSPGKELDGPQSRSGLGVEEKILDPTWTRSPTSRLSSM